MRLRSRAVARKCISAFALPCHWNLGTDRATEYAAMLFTPLSAKRYVRLLQDHRTKLRVFVLVLSRPAHCLRHLQTTVTWHPNCMWTALLYCYFYSGQGDIFSDLYSICGDECCPSNAGLQCDNATIPGEPFCNVCSEASLHALRPHNWSQILIHR